MIMNMKRVIIVLVAALAIGSVTCYSAVPKRSGARKSTVAARTAKKKTASVSPLAALEKALAGTTTETPTSMAALDKSLAWAENIRLKYAEPLSGPQKMPDGKVKYTGRMESLMYEIKKYSSIDEALQEHISKQSRYNSDMARMYEGERIVLDYLEFLTLQHINHILGMLPDESNAAFKQAMVEMYLTKQSFLSLVSAQNELQGVPQGSIMGEGAEISNCESVTKGMNEMLFKIWEILDGNGSSQSTTIDQALRALNDSFKYAGEDYGDSSVTHTDFDNLKSKFYASGEAFAKAYGEWLAKYPGHSDKLTNTASSLFKEWASLSDEDAYKTALNALETEDIFYRVEQGPFYGTGGFGTVVQAIIDAMSPEIIFKAQSLGTTYLTFELYITKDGNVKDVKILSGGTDEINAEIARAAKSLSGFKPGKVNGVAVNSILGPINLAL